MPKHRAMSNTPKVWPELGELLEWIGEANLSHDENAVVIDVSAEAVLNAYTQWYDSHRQASVKIADLAALEHRLCKEEEEMAVWKQRCDRLFTISEQTAKLQDRAASQNLIVQKIKPHKPKRVDGSQDLKVVAKISRRRAALRSTGRSSLSKSVRRQSEDRHLLAFSHRQSVPLVRELH